MRTWFTGLTASHFWDCNGAGCDATTLQPWDPSRYAFSPFYAPQDPALHGGSVYGESLWLTGAASEALAALLGDDAACCGRDDNDDGGGCGKCLLVRSPSALQGNATALVMKKSHCPPSNPLCGTGKAHFDIAVPGFDYSEASLAHVCASAERAETYLTSAEAQSCGCAPHAPSTPLVAAPALWCWRTAQALPTRAFWPPAPYMPCRPVPAI